MKKETTKKKRFRFRFNFSDYFKSLYFYRVFSDIRDMIIMYKITKKNKSYLEEYGFRINMIGQPYTVVNLPEEIAQQERDIEPYMVMQLRKMDGIFIKLQLTELIYPEIERIKKPGSETEFEDAFLVVLRTNDESLSIWKFLGHLIKYTVIIIGLKILISILINSNFFTVIGDFLNKYL